MSDASPAADDALRQLLAYPSAADPYPLYDVLRDTAPVYLTDYGVCAVTGYAEVGAALRHPDIGHDFRRALANYDCDAHESLRQIATSLATRNPPEHTRLRRMIGRALSRDAVDRRAAAIARQVARLLDEAEDRAAAGKPVDMMETAAFPLPVAVIAGLLGVPGSDTAMLRPLVSDITVMTEFSFSDADLERADAAAEKLRDYFTALIADRRARPREDLLTAMARQVDADDHMDDGDLVAMCTFLFIAGFETTTNSIGKGLWTLLHHPDQLRRWRDNPGLGETAAQEITRYDSYVHCANRTALADIELYGQKVPAGTVVLVFVAAANRDPAAFPDPDRFDIGRRGKTVMSFGVGPHFCLGANLALLELRIFFTEFLSRFGVAGLGGTPEWHHGLMLRGIKELPLHLRTTCMEPNRA